MRPLFDEFLLLVDAIHLLFILLLDVLSVNFHDFGLQSFIILNIFTSYIYRVMIHVTNVVLERFYVSKVVRLCSVELVDFFFHSASFRHQVLHDQVHVLIGPFEVNDFCIHTGNLFLHFGYFLFSWPNISFKFLDFIVKNKLELL